ncbi:MAG: guanine deaminase [Phormidesmis sp.]
MLTAIRGSFVDFIDDPFYQPEAACVRYFSDGLLVLEGGKVSAFGDYDSLQENYRQVPTTHYIGQIIVPGFIDTHIHYPQTEMIASYGEQLLEWLNRYAFPTEKKFQDKAYAAKVADVFLDQLLRNGTTTALVFAAVFSESVDAFFEAAERRNLCMIAGKVMMDRNAPADLCDTAESGYLQTKALIEKWHKRRRLRYAVTPRFAITSTDEQLKKAGELLREFPDVYLHTHISENLDEVALVQQLFPDCEGYLDVYDRAGLVKERAVFAHGVHLTDAEFRRLSDCGCAIAFCPTSNLFLGSGLFDLEKAKSAEHPVKVGLGTDVGGGTSFSMLQTTNEAYKVTQMRQQNLSPFKALYLATLGGARTLFLEDSLGNFEVGKEADFVVLNPRATPLMSFRNSKAIPETLDELGDLVFSLIMLGDDRVVAATYVMGEIVYRSVGP